MAVNNRSTQQQSTSYSKNSSRFCLQKIRPASGLTPTEMTKMCLWCLWMSAEAFRRVIGLQYLQWIKSKIATLRKHKLRTKSENPFNQSFFWGAKTHEIWSVENLNLLLKRVFARACPVHHLCFWPFLLPSPPGLVWDFHFCCLRWKFWGTNAPGRQWR